MKPIHIYLKKGRHKTQPWTFIIDNPGPKSKQTKQERYVKQWSAYRGAVRQLGLKWEGTKHPYHVAEIKRGALKLRPVKMVVVK